MARRKRRCAAVRREWLGRLVGGAALIAWCVVLPPAQSGEPGGATPLVDVPLVDVPLVDVAVAVVSNEAPPPDETPTRTRPPRRLSRPQADLSASATREASDPAEVDLWHQNLVRERQIEVRLRSAQRDFESGRLVGGLAELQSILERDEDVFVRCDAHRVPCGAHALADRLLAGLPPAALATYETLYGREARQLLASALAGPNLGLLARVVRRFYHTAAGFDAGNRLAGHWTDHGCDELAWSWWQRVLLDPVHRDRVGDVHRLRAAECCQRLGRPREARAVLGPIADEKIVAIAGRERPAARWKARLSQLIGPRAVDADTRVVGGTSHRNGSANGSPPALGRPLWRGNLAGDQSRHLEALSRDWESHQLQNGLPIGTSQFPILVGQKLVYRDFEGLRAVDVETGRLLWFYACASSLNRDISVRQTVPADGNPDPNNVMRYVVGNCTLGTLASDGRRVFALDRIENEEPSPGAATGDAAAGPVRQSNVLAALDLECAGVDIQPQWTAGGRAGAFHQPQTLAGHFFLGPPLPVEDCLFAVSEAHQGLYLSCLKCETGELVWSQALCSVPQPIGADHQRFALVCSPAYSDGIVVCPTQSGVLVAVDSLSGALLWAASHDDGEPRQRQQIAAWPYSARRRYGHAGYINLPCIHGSSVVYLPAHSDHVQCLDLATGRLRWRARREDHEPATATEYVAAITDDVVVMVGRRRCRGLWLESGKEKWGVRLGATPTGRGVRLGANYHVPLDDGRLVSLDLESGHKSAAPARLGAARLGNLLAGRDLIVSMGAGDIAVFPQAHRALKSIEDEARSGVQTAERELESAELELTRGEVDRAEQRLEEMLQRRATTLDVVRVADLMRELITAKLSDGSLPMGSERRKAALERLAALSEGPEKRGRYLAASCRWGREAGEAAAALAAARELAALEVDALLEAGDDPSRLAAPHVLAAGFIKRMPRDQTPPFRDYDARLEGDLEAAHRARDQALLRRMIAVSGDACAADRARLRLAQLLLDSGQWQEAEMVLLASRASPVAATAGPATRLLIDLWNQQGLHHDAALLTSEMSTRFAAVSVAPDHCGATWLLARRADPAANEAYRRLSPPGWSGEGVKIAETRANNEALQAVYSGNNVQCLATPRQSPFDLFDKGRGAAGVFSVVDRHTGQEYPETIHVPGRVSYLVSTHSGWVQHANFGHFFPLGGAGAIHGVSLLERKLLWSNVPRGLAGVKDVVKVGPAGAGFCSFQYHQHLYVVDPLDGRVLWQRDDIEKDAGLTSEQYLGIIGDDRVLVVFASNGADYTVYDTFDGAELRRGRLDIQTRAPRRAYGRHLFHHTAAESRRLRVWDAALDRFVWDEPADQIAEASVLEGVPLGTKVFTFVRESNEAAFVTTSGQIKVIDLVGGREKFEIALMPELLENLSSLKAFRDHERYYFDVQRSYPPAKVPSSQVSVLHDASIPCVHVEGDLCAVDAGSRRMLWHRPVGKRSLLQLPDLPLPVFVALCRVRKDDQSSLSIEVIDLQTGDLLGSRHELLSDRLLQAFYDRPRRLIELRGGKTTISLEFPTTVARLNAGGRVAGDGPAVGWRGQSER